jgi:hypothetical protein
MVEFVVVEGYRALPWLITLMVVLGVLYYVIKAAVRNGINESDAATYMELLAQVQTSSDPDEDSGEPGALSNRT